MNDNKEKEMSAQEKPKKLQLKTKVEAPRNFTPDSRTVRVEVRRARAPQKSDAVEKQEPVRNLVTKTEADSSNLTEHEKTARLAAIKNAVINPSTREKDEQQRQKDYVPSNQRREAENEATQEVSSDALDSSVESKKERPTRAVGTPAIDDDSDEQERGRRSRGKAVDVKKAPTEAKVRLDERQYSRKFTIHSLEQEERVRSQASIRRAREKAKRGMIKTDQKPQEKIVREVIVPETITVQELSNRMAVRGVDLIKSLMQSGIVASVNHVLDADTAEILVNEFGHKIKRVTDADVENVMTSKEEDKEENLKRRAPVVTIMGHVDHGKTSLLDAIRKTNVTQGEAGGITQHIGAYRVTTAAGDLITFLDTPGHAAFTAMRARGAKVTDIVILVVAADDGIMPQTVEAINHAKAASVPIIVAINKIDKPGANIQKVRDGLLAHELISEDLGGETLMVEVSAKTGANLDKLLETILLQAEVLDLKANPDSQASGAVVEAKLSPGRGIVATFLVQRGTLRSGEIVVAGNGFGKVRALLNELGENIKEAGPSTPVEVLGLNELPDAGDEFSAVQSEKQAREITEYRVKKLRDRRAAENVVSLDNIFKQAGKGATLEVAVVVKADVQGSAEAIVTALKNLSGEKVNVKVVHTAAGGITESDVSLAKTTGAIILGFNVRANVQAKSLADTEGVEIRQYSIIYNLIDEMKEVMAGRLKPTVREQFLGNATIQKIFKMSKYGKVAGCIVREGLVKRGAGVRLIRDSVVIHEGKLKTLKRFQDDVAEVKQGIECGMAFENYEDIKEGDTIEAFELIEEKATL